MNHNELIQSLLLEGEPDLDCFDIPLPWSLNQDGVDKRVEKFRSGEIYVEYVTVTPVPVVLVSRLKSIQTGNEEVCIAWKRLDEWNCRVVPRSMIAKASEIIKLADAGLPITSKRAGDLEDYLTDFESANIERLPISSVSQQMGWQKDSEFLWGNTCLHRTTTESDGTTEGSTDAEESNSVAFRGTDDAAEQLARGFHQQGSYDQWYTMARRAMVHPKAALAVYSALVPPLLSIIGAPNFVVDWCGRTTTGKTTVLRLAASCWGQPDERQRNSVLHTWDATRVWIERTSAVLEGLPLILDDTKRASSGGDVAQVIYDVTSGRGRGRGNPGGMQASSSWHTVLLSSGEAPATSFTQDGGIRARVLSSWGYPFGKADQSTAPLVLELEQTVRRNFGHVGPMFVQHLIRMYDKWPNLKDEFHSIQDELVTRAGNQIFASRLATPMASIEMAIRTANNAFGWQPIDLVDELWDELVNEAGEADRSDDALRSLVSWAKSNMHRFWGRHPVDQKGHPKAVTASLAGRWDSGDWEFIAFFPHILDSLLGGWGFEPQAIKRTWRDKEWLDVEAGRKGFDKQHRVCGERTRLITIPRKAIEAVEG